MHYYTEDELLEAVDILIEDYELTEEEAIDIINEIYKKDQAKQQLKENSILMREDAKSLAKGAALAGTAAAAYSLYRGSKLPVNLASAKAKDAKNDVEIKKRIKDQLRVNANNMTALDYQNAVAANKYADRELENAHRRSEKADKNLIKKQERYDRIKNKREERKEKIKNKLKK